MARASTFVQPAKAATSSIPIVFLIHADPVGTGHVASLARPGGNITGLAVLMTDLAPKGLELLISGVPVAKRIAVLWSPHAPSHAPALKAVEEAARTLRVQLQPVGVRTAAELEGAFAAMARARAQAVLVLAAPIFFAERQRVAELAIKHRLPTMSTLKEVTEAGGLMSYAPNFEDLFRRGAIYVDKILKGSKPADLPVEQAAKFELVINRASREADVFSGSQPRRGKSQSPVTWVAGWRETKTLKPTDGAIERMVRESPGRNGSERTGGPEILKPRRPSLTVERRRQHGPSHLADAAGHSGGVIATAR